MTKLLRLVIVGYALHLIAVVLFVRPLFDTNLFASSAEIISLRRNYYPASIARLFENKVTYFITAAERNFFEALDINRYFFASHPRERVGVNEYPIAHYLFLPLFVVGIVFYNPLRKLSWILWLVSLALITVLGARNDIVSGLAAWPLYLNIFGGLWIGKRWLS